MFLLSQRSFASTHTRSARPRTTSLPLASFSLSRRRSTTLASISASSACKHCRAAGPLLLLASLSSSTTAAASAAGAAAPTTQQMDKALLQDRIRGALWGALIGDALSMPVHWYYNPNDIVRDYNGGITKFEPPRARHPSSIMSVSNTGGHGRGDQSGRLVGDVILHGKHQFWGKPQMHYHQGMKAGENTLNALCMRVVMRGITANQGQYDTKRFLQDYVQFMTTPGTHNDTYAESFHRDFFSNWAKGVPPERCAEGTEGHNTAQIGGFVMLPPVITAALAKAGAASADTKAAAIKHLRLTHESRKLAGFAEAYAGMFHDLLVGGKPLKEVVRGVAKDVKIADHLDKLATGPGFDDIRVVHSVFGSACYIEDSFPVMLYLSYKYSDSFEKAVLANTNVGGENCHRGAALGALMGAAVGESGIPASLIQGLNDSAAIRKEIDAFCAAVLAGAQPGPHSEL